MSAGSKKLSVPQPSSSSPSRPSRSSSPLPPQPKKYSTSSNLGVNYDRRHKDRRASSMQIEVESLNCCNNK